MMNRPPLMQKLYNPGHLLDTLIKKLGLHSDKQLSRKLKVTASIIMNLRHKRIPMGACLLLWMHELTGISIAELRELMGDRRKKFRMHLIRPKNNDQCLS